MGTMRDIQRERLKQLLTSAILELWKKETGSLSSVIIEGTVCITSGNGKTTVLQMADKFGGAIPEAEDSRYRDIMTPRMYHSYTAPVGVHSLGSPTFPEAPRVECNNPHAMQTLLDNLSPASMVSPVADYSRTSHDRSRSPPPNKEQMMDTGKEDLLSESGSDSTSDGSKPNPPTSTPDRDTAMMLPGTGYYTPESEERSSRSESSPQSSALDLSSLSEPIDRKEDRCSPSGKDSSTQDENHNDLDAENAMDLTPGKDADLALSPPQDYTAQVRDVIRQKLMASRYVCSIKEEQDTSPEHGSIVVSSGSGGNYHLPQPGLMLGGNQLTQYGRHLPASMPILTRGVVLSGPLHSILKHKPPTGYSPTVCHSPSPPNTTSSPPLHTKPDPDSPPITGDSPTEANGEQRIYRCEFCSKTFLFKSKYLEHLPVHTNARPFQCHLCSRTYKYKYDLRVHLRTHMGIPTKSTICPFCSGKFETNKMLRMHIKELHRDKQKVSEEDCTQASDNIPPAI